MQDLAFVYPADLEQAEKHRLATRIFKGSGQQLAQSERCTCCGRRIGAENPGQGCWYNPISQLMFLGPGVPLLFVFIQNAMLFLGLLTAVFFFYALITNILGGSCEASPRCITNVFNQLSLPNKITDQLSLGVQLAVSAGFLLLYFVFSQYILYRIRTHNQQCDDIITSPSDYSIIIQGLPTQTTQQQIRETIKQHAFSLDQQLQASTNKLKIAEVILSYRLNDYIRTKKEQEDQFMEAVSKDQQSSFVRSSISKPNETGSFAIVVFEKQMSKQTFFKSDQNGSTKCCAAQEKFIVGDKAVRIRRAPQPDDIIWENAHLPGFRRRLNIFFSYFFGIAILMAGGYIQYRLQLFQNGIQDTASRDYFAYVSSVIVTVLNAVIVAFLRIITQLEGFQTITQLNRSLLIKICLFSFFNGGVFYSVANVLAQSLNSFNIQGNFAFEITLFMGLNAITPNLTNFITRKLQFPSFFIRKLLKCGFFKRNQKQANEMFELSVIQFPLQYAYVIRTVWLTCFYAPFAPLVVPIAIFGLIIFYFTEAELFRSSYRVPNMLSMDLTRMAMRLLDYTGLVFSIGQLLTVLFIKFTLKASFSPLQQTCLALCFGLSFAIVFFPSLRVSKWLFKFQERYENQTSYSQAISKFQVTYEGTNPLADPSKKQRDGDFRLLKSLDLFKLFEMKDFNLFRATNNNNNGNYDSNINPLLSPQQNMFSPFHALMSS